MQINGLVRDDAVTGAVHEPADETGAARPSAPRHPLVYALAVLVFAECALLVAATIYLVIELLVATPASLPSAVALTVLTAMAAIWLGFIAANVLRGRAWVRGATIVWQALQIAVAIGCFQGIFARPDLGWLLLVPSLVVLGLVFTPPVVAATSARD